jgi:hypothetical protein
LDHLVSFIQPDRPDRPEIKKCQPSSFR